MSNRFRRWTATEEIADALEDWLDEVKPAHEVMLDKDGIIQDGDETPTCQPR